MGFYWPKVERGEGGGSSVQAIGGANGYFGIILTWIHFVEGKLIFGGEGRVGGSEVPTYPGEVDVLGHGGQQLVSIEGKVDQRWVVEYHPGHGGGLVGDGHVAGVFYYGYGEGVEAFGKLPSFDEFCSGDAFKDKMVGIEVSAQVKACAHVGYASLQDDGWWLIAGVGIDADACAFYGEFEFDAKVSPIELQHVDHQLQIVAGGGGVVAQVRTVGRQDVEVGLYGEGLGLHPCI